MRNYNSINEYVHTRININVNDISFLFDSLFNYNFVMEKYLDLLLDTLLDSLKVFAIAFIIYFLLTFFESKIARLLEKKKKIAPIFGSLAGIIPQCGISVVGADLYHKSHITIGTLIAIFIACSDEALPIIFGDFTGKWWMVFPLLIVKIIGGTLVGLLVDWLFARKNAHVDDHLEHCEGEEEVHVGCCHHHIEEEPIEESKLQHHLIHPLIHSLKIFAYSFVISYLFGVLIILIGEENIIAFLAKDGPMFWLTPILSIIIGLIPNCASSVLISQLFVGNMIPFGALVAGLCANAGIGPISLLRHKEHFKDVLLIFGVQVVASIVLGYICLLVNVLVF